MKKKSPTKRRKDQKNEKRRRKRPYKKTKVKCKNEKKNIKSIVRILRRKWSLYLKWISYRSLLLHYKPMTSPIWSHFLCSHISGCLHEGQAYGILIPCIEYLSEWEWLSKMSYNLNYYIVWSRTFIYWECIWNMRIQIILSLNFDKINWSCNYLRIYDIQFETI